MKVTVIMPARNEGRNVETTLQSLLRQTRLPDEIVVADGCSSDDTPERVRAFQQRGVPIKIVANESLFAGGGRNAATRAAAHDILVNMDFGNVADPDWLSEMVRPFESDPDLDLLGGLFLPIAETRFERTAAAVCYTIDCVLPSLTPSQIGALVPDDFVPGGMCMAYRRSAWDRAGGFCTWARKGQDRLFGYRVRRVGGKLGYTLSARVQHHMARSFSALARRQFFYDLWSARLGLPGVGAVRLGGAYLCGLALLVAATRIPALVPVAVVAGLAFIDRRAWRRLRQVSSATGARFGIRETLLAVPLLLVHDGSFLLGRLAGALDRALRPRWRSMTTAYLERGQ